LLVQNDVNQRDIDKLVNGTADPAFACDGLGYITAWNDIAADTFGRPGIEAVGRPCSEIIDGVDDSARACSLDCAVIRCAGKRFPMRNFDLRIPTPGGGKWFNVSVLLVETANSDRLHTIHVLRQVDVQKRLEKVVRDFVAADDILPLLASSRPVLQDAYLTGRELEVLGKIAGGKSSAAAAKDLGISVTTVNNHMQNILRKLGAHSRLEAVLRAERLGML
jgi:DNA-binding CsgD family transcriptional regulator